MPLTLNGTTGIAGVDGSASTPAVQGSDTNTGVFYPAADTVGVSTGGSERMRVDSSGNVGIGTSSPGAKLDVYTNSAALSFIYGRNTLSTALYGADASGAGYAYVSSSTAGSSANMYVGTAAAANTVFVTSGSEKARVDSSGNLLVGTTSYTTGKVVIQAKDASYGGIQLVQFGGSNYWTQNVDSLAGYTWGKNGADFWYAGRSGSNNCVSSNGSWVNSSDARLKKNIEPLQNCLQDVCKLQGVSFTRINGGNEEIGLIAQEVEKVFPRAVEAPSSDTDHYALNYGALVAPLIEAIKELKAELDALKGTVDAQAAEIAALKANAPA